MIFKEQLGGGAFGKVFKATYEGREVAAKCVMRTNGRAILREQQAYETIPAHDHIVRCLAIVDSSAAYVVFVLDLCDVDLYTYIIRTPGERLNETESRGMFAQMSDALNHLHCLHIAHRDIKLENWLLENQKKTIKLADFGLAALNTSGVIRFDCVGTASYCAPEVLAKTGHFACKSDIWSLGVCLFCMLLGFFPYERARREDYRFARFFHASECIVTSLLDMYGSEIVLSSEVRHLLHQMLKPHDDRASIGDVRRHPWLQMHSPPNVAGKEVVDTSILWRSASKFVIPYVRSMQRLTLFASCPSSSA